MGEPLLSGQDVSNMTGVQVFRAVILFGSSVITSYKGRNLTFARNSAGNYTVTLPRIYRLLVGAAFSFIDASGAVLFGVVTTDSVATDGTFIFEVRTEAGTATDPVSGDKLICKFEVTNDPFNDLTVTV